MIGHVTKIGVKYIGYAYSDGWRCVIQASQGDNPFTAYRIMKQIYTSIQFVESLRFKKLVDIGLRNTLNIS